MTHPLPRLIALLVCLLPLAAPALASPPGGCPPGLAKKNPPCVPPGLAKSDGWQEGEVVPPEVVTHVIVYPWRYDLPPPGPGERYIVVGNQILKVDEDSYAVIALFQAIDILLD